MKKYKLLKNTPTIPAGTMFHEVTSEFDKSRELVRIMPLGANTSPQWTTEDIINFDEWFEEINEEKIDWNWKPSNGDRYYYYVNTDSYIWDGDEIDRENYAHGSVFKTKNQAQKHLEWLKALATIRRTSDFEPDWGDEDQQKHGFYYNYLSGNFCTTSSWQTQCMPLPHYRTKEDAEAVIENYEPELRVLFGVE